MNEENNKQSTSNIEALVKASKPRNNLVIIFGTIIINVLITFGILFLFSVNGYVFKKDNDVNVVETIAVEQTQIAPTPAPTQTPTPIPIPTATSAESGCETVDTEKALYMSGSAAQDDLSKLFTLQVGSCFQSETDENGNTKITGWISSDLIDTATGEAKLTAAANGQRFYLGDDISDQDLLKFTLFSENAAGYSITRIDPNSKIGYTKISISGILQ